MIKYYHMLGDLTHFEVLTAILGAGVLGFLLCYALVHEKHLALMDLENRITGGDK